MRNFVRRFGPVQGSLALSCAGRSAAGAVAALGLLSTIATPVAARPATVDLELVLAVDVSGSMDSGERALQRNGYAAAFRHPEILAAIASGVVGRIAVIYFEWAGFDHQRVIVPWTVITGPGDAFAVADRIEAAETEPESGTSISGALAFASGLFAGSGVTGLRRAIDVSGDGPNNTGLAVAPVRDRVVAEGIDVNGLPIMLRTSGGANDPVELDTYYEDCVIGGPGAFIVTVDDISRFAAAVRRKLVLEIAGIVPQPRLFRAAATAPRTDCMIGEKQIIDSFYGPQTRK